jgi:phospholipase C
MAFHLDYDYVVEGDAIGFRKTADRHVDSLAAAHGLSVSLWAVSGKLEVKVSAWNFNQPTRSIGPGGGTAQWNHVQARVELFAAGNPQPKATWHTQAGWSVDFAFLFEYTVGVAGGPPGQWEVRVTNESAVVAVVSFGATYFFSRQTLRSTSLPLALIDHTYQLLLEALTPNASIYGNQATVSFGAELLGYFGSPPPPQLGPHVITLPHGLEGTGHTLHFEVDAWSGRELLAAMRERWQATDDALQQLKLQSGTSPTASLIQTQIDDNNHWKHDWELTVEPDFATLHASVACTDIDLTTEIIDLGITQWDFDVDISDVLVDVYVAFDTNLQYAHALVLSSAQFGGDAAAAEALGFIPQANELIEDFLAPPIDQAGGLLGRYLGEALVDLCARDQVVFDLSAPDAWTWRVKHTAAPKEMTKAPGPVHPEDVQVDESAGAVAVEVGGAGTRAHGPARRPPSVALPESFVVRPRGGETVSQTVARLDRIETIVFVMMENRSFDHMLGYLHGARPGVEGLSGNESNACAGYVPDIKVQAAQEIVPGTYTRILHGPEHGHTHVLAQVAGGTMQGFAQDYENAFPGEANRVMSYYTGDDLHSYNTLASLYGICDHWFSSHPGPTWPNRWITMSGTTPTVENFAIDDPRMGFMEGATVFDILDGYGIDWRIFESDLSIIRTFDRYRLNTQRVVPLVNRHDPSKSFIEVALEGKLPPVVWVEPNFSDLPPLSTADDDLVPVDVRRGQNFVARIFDRLSTSPQWQNMLFVLTYDEHGGFYDHVPPPGTPLGPPEWYDAATGRGLASQVYFPTNPHPDPAPDDHVKVPRHLGVRVPAFAISPWVSQGSVCKEVFDHASIIKTILLRHRAKLPASAFSMLGPRVSATNHLGLALDLDARRTDAPPHLQEVPYAFTQARRTKRTGPARAAAPAPVERPEFHESLTRAFLPKR